MRENRRCAVVARIFGGLHQAPLWNLDDLANVRREFVLQLLIGIRHDSEQSKVDVRQTARQAVAPGAHTTTRERKCSFRSQQHGNWRARAQGFTNLTSVGCPASKSRVSFSNSISIKWVIFAEGSGLIIRIFPSTC